MAQKLTKVKKEEENPPEKVPKLPMPKKRTTKKKEPKTIGNLTIVEKPVHYDRKLPATFETIRSPEGLDELHEMAKEGLSLQQMADRLGVNVSTLWGWSKKYSDVRDVLLDGRAVSDDRVEMSLYEMCFPHDEKEVKVIKDGQGNVIRQEVRTIHKEASVPAIQYWLNNRQAKKWKPKQEEGAGEAQQTVRVIYDLDTKAEPAIAKKPKKKKKGELVDDDD